MVNAYLPAYTDRKELWTIDGDTIRWLGVVLFTAGGALRIWSVFVLGQRFSGLVAIQSGHTLVTNGVYGIVRHPSYLGLFINSLGWSLAFRSGVGVILTLLFVPPLVCRINAEEDLRTLGMSTLPTALIRGAWFPGSTNKLLPSASGPFGAAWPPQRVQSGSSEIDEVALVPSSLLSDVCLAEHH